MRGSSCMSTILPIMESPQSMHVDATRNAQDLNPLPFASAILNCSGATSFRFNLYCTVGIVTIRQSHALRDVVARTFQTTDLRNGPKC